VRWPWHRARQAEAKARQAEQWLAQALREHEAARRLANETREIVRRNGFKDAIVALFEDPQR
jgi:hypothetical protein